MKYEVEQLIGAAVHELYDIEVVIVATRPEEQFGDFTTNIALQLSKQLTLRPLDIADQLCQNLRTNSNASNLLSDVAVAGPGFLNVTLSDDALLKTVTQMPPKSLAGQTILVEYSDPNPLKPLHAGHLYTTLVGDTIAQLIENAGANVVRINYGGDVGRHIGISLWAIVKRLGGEHPEKLNDIPAAERPAWLGQCYVEGTLSFEDNEQAKLEITAVNKRVYQVHTDGDHDTPFAQIYWTVRQWSYDYFKTLYDQLEVHPFDRFIPESEVFQLGESIVREQLAKGVYSESQGAIIFVGEPFGLHTRVFINSAGLPTYETKDVGLLFRKWEDYHFDRSIVITANEQAQYYQVMLKSVEQYAPEITERSQHLTHGTVKLQGGRKMSSRKGTIITALEILEAARQAGAETTSNPSEETILAAVKYAFAKSKIGGDILYDPKESIALEGNSGPYLQYAHARAHSILLKSDTSYDDTMLVSLQAPERSLLRKIGEYSDVVTKATEELLPHYICTYLYELAQSFNRFYEQSRVIGDERETIRLKLVEYYANTLKSGLLLLGIHAPDHM